MSLHGELIDSILRLPGSFEAVATNDPVAAALLAAGVVLFGLATGAGAYLVLGAVLQWLTPESSSPTYRPAR